MVSDMDKVAIVSDLVKEAILLPILKGVGSLGLKGAQVAGRAIKKNPMGTLGNIATAGFGASEVMESASKATRDVGTSKLMHASGIPPIANM